MKISRQIQRACRKNKTTSLLVPKNHYSSRHYMTRHQKRHRKFRQFLRNLTRRRKSSITLPFLFS